MPVPTTEMPPALEQSMLGRTRLILYAFSSGAPELTLSDLVRRTGLPRSSMHRILGQLVEFQALERTEAGYRLGLSMVELGWLAAQQNRLRHCSLPHLRALQEQTGTVAHLAVLDGHEIVYMVKLGRAEGTRAVSRLGGRRAAYCTAEGKALLAHAGESALAGALAEGTPPRTHRTITSPRLLRQELAHIREHGVSFDREECFRGVFGIAVPLRDPEGKAVAAASLTGNPRHMDRKQLVPQLLSTAGRIAADLFLPARRTGKEETAAPSSPASASWPEGVLDDAVSWPRLNDWM
ncbi:IclR family transcriptional regulator [Nocardiopsis nanhaiensis]